MNPFGNLGYAFAAVLAGFGASFAAAHAVAPNWSARAGLDVWNLPSAKEDYREALECRERVNAEEEAAIHRREDADHVARELIRGLPLPRAAEELMTIFAKHEGMDIAIKSVHPDAPTLRHLFAKHAIDRVARLMPAGSPARMAVLVRLNMEYARLDASPEP